MVNYFNNLNNRRKEKTDSNFNLKNEGAHWRLLWLKMDMEVVHDDGQAGGGSVKAFIVVVGRFGW